MSTKEALTGALLLTAAISRLCDWKQPASTTSRGAEAADVVSESLAASCAESVRDALDQTAVAPFVREAEFDTTALRADLRQTLEPLLAADEARYRQIAGVAAAGSRLADHTIYLASEGFGALLAEFPALTYVLSARMATWATSVATAIVETHRLATQRTAALGIAPAATLHRVGSSGGDVHDGREGMVLGFADHTFVFKPRDLRVDELVGRVARTVGLLPRIPETISTPSYGCARFEAEATDRSDRDVKSLYESLGHALALSYVLGLRDLHAENVVLARDHLVLIDLEVAFVFDDGMDATAPFGLPSSHLIGDHEAASVPRSEQRGLDLLIHTRPAGANAALTKLAAATPGQDPTRFRPEVVRGFTGGLARLRRHAHKVTALLRPGAPFEVRHVLRPTVEYARALRDARPSPQLGTLATRTKLFGLQLASSPDAWQPLVPGEVTALTRGEFPRITTKAGSRSLECHGYVARDALKRAGLDEAIDRIAGSEAPGELDAAIDAIHKAFQ
ncbi:DUF4135 domain-containing protein [Baekduia sp. Peel2402]|uniref:DUF4135 domain-containing protein n=1 Tax=Baekduia sp. Peel2402 TaxID=3458296 RepID=UPI00403E5091